MCPDAATFSFPSSLPALPSTPFTLGDAVCSHSFAFFCSLCWTGGYSAGDHCHERHFRYMCEHCGILWQTLPKESLSPILSFCANCSGIRELNSQNAHLPYHCHQTDESSPDPPHLVCDECLELFLPCEDALVNKSLYTSLDDTFEKVFNCTDWALVCPLCTTQGLLPSVPEGSDMEDWFERQSRPETFTNFGELGKSCRTIVGRREEVGLLCEETTELWEEETENS
jgi:hypothetical protein